MNYKSAKHLLAVEVIPENKRRIYEVSVQTRKGPSYLSCILWRRGAVLFPVDKITKQHKIGSISCESH